MYNFMLALAIGALAFVAGEVISSLTKAWIPSVFISAVIMLLGYWTVFPHDLVSDANLIPFGSTVCCYLMVAHMGTVISLKQLLEQWKTIIICLAGLAGMCIFSMILCPILMDRSFVIVGLPPLTGGLVAATLMQSAAEAKGMTEAAVFAIAMYCVQGFAGYPLTSICLQLEGKKMLKHFRENKQAVVAASREMDTTNGNLITASEKKLFPPIPDRFNSIVMILAKLAIVGWMATMLATIPVPVIGSISGLVWVLVLAVIFTRLGLLDENSLNKSNSYGIVMFSIMMYIFDGLKDCTPEMLGNIVIPMITLIVIGVLGMAIFCFVISKILHTPFLLSFATGLTALYGFPPNAIITESTCEALSETPEEKEYLMGQMFAPMIVGGFVTVTITSVIIAGVFANLL